MMETADEEFDGVTSIDLLHFNVLEDSHASSLLLWVNGDEDSCQIEFDSEFDTIRISLITDSVGKIEKLRNGAKDPLYRAEVWGIKFEHLANIVDAIRAIRKQPA